MDLYYTDTAKRIITAPKDSAYLDHDLSDVRKKFANAPQKWLKRPYNVSGINYMMQRRQRPVSPYWCCCYARRNQGCSCKERPEKKTEQHIRLSCKPLFRLYTQKKHYIVSLLSRNKKTTTYPWYIYIYIPIARKRIKLGSQIMLPLFPDMSGRFTISSSPQPRYVHNSRPPPTQPS